MVRNENIDGLKFLMMFLVVLSHIGYKDYGLELTKILYSFHMPVFIFLSGFFTSPKVTHEKQKRWLKNTFKIYAIAQLAHYCLKIIFLFVYSYVNNKPFDSSLISCDVLIIPEFALWYLVSLMCWRLFVWKLASGNWRLEIGVIVLFLLGGFLPIDKEFSFQRTIAFFPFFYVGYFFRLNNLLNYETKKIPNIICSIGVLCIFLIGLIVARFLPITFVPAFHYNNFEGFLQRLVATFIGMILTLCIIYFTRFNLFRVFARYGSYTLWIYIGHTFLIKIGEYLFGYIGISLNLLSAIILAGVYCVIPICVAEAYYHYKKRVLVTV